MNIRLSSRGLIVISLIAIQNSLFPAFNQAIAMPQVRLEPCPACHGSKSLSLTPPNLGQFEGEIGVTQGKPFKTHRFDVKYDKCPLCNGTGRRERFAPTTPPSDKTRFEPCIDCLGTGVMLCQKCRRTGYVQCNRCQSDRSKKPGWLLTEERTAGRTSRYTRKTVSPCGTCSGIGRVECTTCEGRGGVICRKCSGAGYFPRKERK